MLLREHQLDHRPADSSAQDTCSMVMRLPATKLYSGVRKAVTLASMSSHLDVQVVNWRLSAVAFMQAHCAQLQMEREELLIRVDSTPDRCRADKQLLHVQAKK